MNKSTIIEHALDLLGEHDYLRHSGTERVSDSHYTSTVRECLSAHHWSFARACVTLSPSSENTFTLPADCLRIKFVRYPNSTRRIPSWQLINRSIITPDTSSISLTYTQDITLHSAEIPDSSPHFTQFVIHTLASRLAPTICGTDPGVAIAKDLLARAAEYKHLALVIDRQQDSSNDQDLAGSYIRTNLLSAQQIKQFCK